MTRIDQIAFTVSQTEVLKKFLEQLLTPTAFEKRFDSDPENNPSALLGEVVRNLVPDGIENDLTASSRLFYEELVRDADTGDYLNSVIGGARSTSDESEIFDRSAVNRALSVFAHLSSESLERQRQDAAVELNAIGNSIADFYGNNFVSLISLLDLGDDAFQSLPSDGALRLQAHSNNHLVLESALLRIFGEDQGQPNDASPRGQLNLNVEAGYAQLKAIIEAYEGDVSKSGQADVSAGLQLLESWKVIFQKIEDAVNPLSYAVATGIIDPNSSAVAGLLGPLGSGVSGADLVVAADSNKTVTDPLSGQIMSGDTYVQTYLADLPSFSEFQTAWNSLRAWVDTFGIDFEQLFDAYSGNVRGFYLGGTIGALNAQQFALFDIDAVYGAIGDRTAEADQTGAARAFAFTEFQAFVAENLLPSPDGAAPNIPDAWLLAAEFEGLSMGLVPVLSGALNDPLFAAEAAIEWKELVAARQDVIAAFIQADDDARVFYTLQIAEIDRQIDVKQNEILDRLEGNTTESRIELVQSIFQSASDPATKLLENAAEYDGIRTEQPILKTPLPLTEADLLDLRWSVPADTAPAFDLDTLYNNGADNSDWRGLTVPGINDQLLPAIAVETGQAVNLSEIGTILELENALRALPDGVDFIIDVSQLSTDLIAYNDALKTYEAERLAFLNEDPLVRDKTWQARDAEISASSNVTEAYQKVTAGLENLGLPSDFLQMEFSIRALLGGGTGGGGELDAFGFVPEASTLLADIETQAVRYDAVILPALLTVAGSPDFDSIMPANWRTITRDRLKQNLDTVLSGLDLAEGAAPEAWRENLAAEITVYNTAVAAYEKNALIELLNGKTGDDVRVATADTRQAIDTAFENVVNLLVGAEGNFGDNPSDPFDLLADTFGFVRNADGIDAADAGTGSVSDAISSGVTPPFIVSTEAGDQIRFFDLTEGAQKNDCGRLQRS